MLTVESWGNACPVYLKKLHLLQKRTVRFICKVDYTDPTAMLFKSLRIFTIYDIYKLRILLLMYKVVNKHVFISVRSEQYCSNKNTRSDKLSKLSLIIPRTEYGKRSFDYSAAFQWNLLPLETRNLPSIKLFKIAIFNRISNER